MKKRNIFIAIIILVILISISCLSSILFVNRRLKQMGENNTQISFADTNSKFFAIRELEWLKGQVLEVFTIYWASESEEIEDILFMELGYLSEFHSDNPYLTNFRINITSSSDVGEICEEINSQIEDQIYLLENGQEKILDKKI